jgi:hypothetical protein
MAAAGADVLSRRFLVLVVAALALPLAGCGGSSRSFEPAAAAADTAAAKTAKVSFDTTIGSGGQTLQMSGEGVVDFQNRSAQMSFDVGDLLRATGQPATSNEKWTIVTRGFILYMRAPSLAQQLPGGKQWLKLDVAALAKAANVNLGQFRQLTQSDPSQMLDFLRAASGKIDKVGEEQVRGTHTTHYRANIDLDRVAEQAPPKLRRTFRKSIASLKRGLGTDIVPVDVWVDDDNRVRRLQEHLPVAGGGAASRIDFGVDFYEFGTPVTIHPPPPSQVVDLGKILGGA